MNREESNNIVSTVRIKKESQSNPGDVTYTSLIKDELKSAIKSRRVSRGLPDVKFEPTSPARDYEVTEEEEKRRKLRRERNRLAAYKCRRKKKYKEKQIIEEHTTQIELNKKLKEEKDLLEKERERLTTIWRNHSVECSLHKTSAKMTRT
ncbi:cyclic AMP-dependent transcription factor ATF-3-like [Ptychodera flava]|uniref:cyclic AMP-dependent transcription factor ATF-3-like n=1 Tax=Ptychodera flava TaxID=63121 RepID=UPI00396A4866